MRHPADTIYGTQLIFPPEVVARWCPIHKIELTDDPDYLRGGGMRQCKCERVPLRKSRYGPEMLQLGQCPDCGMHWQELD